MADLDEEQTLVGGNRIKLLLQYRNLIRNPLYEEVADYTVRTDDQSAKVVANQIVKMLEER